MNTRTTFFDRVKSLLRSPRELSPDARLVAIALLHHLNNNEMCWPSRPTLLRECGIPLGSSKRITKATRELEQAGIFEIRKSPGESNRYIFRSLATSIMPTTLDAFKLMADENKEVSRRAANPPWPVHSPPELTDEPLPPDATGNPQAIDTSVPVVLSVADDRDIPDTETPPVADWLCDPGPTTYSKEYQEEHGDAEPWWYESDEWQEDALDEADYNHVGEPW